MLYTSPLVISRDERECLFQSHSLKFPTVHSHSRFRSQAKPDFIPIHFPVSSIIPVTSRCHSRVSILLNILLFFMCAMKQITSKLTKNGSLLVSKTTENPVTNTNF